MFWTPVNTGLINKRILFLIIHPATPRTVYAATPGGGIYKTTNGGRSWIPAGLADTFVYTLAIHPSHPETVYAGTYGQGVFQTP